MISWDRLERKNTVCTVNKNLEKRLFSKDSKSIFKTYFSIKTFQKKKFNIDPCKKLGGGGVIGSNFFIFYQCGPNGGPNG